MLRDAELGFVLEIGLLQPPGLEGRHIADQPYHQLLANLGREALVGRRYKQPATDANDEVPMAPLIDAGPLEIAPSEIVELRARQDLVVFPQEVESAPVLRLRSGNRYPTRWDYHAQTRLPVLQTASDTDDLRIVEALWILAELGDTAHLPVMRCMVGHSSHFVRWAAMVTAFKLDVECGLQLLAAGLEDPYRPLRRAAQTALREMGLLVCETP